MGLGDALSEVDGSVQNVVTAPHEALHRIFQEDPTLFARAFTQVLGVAFPRPKTVSVINADLTEIEPLERRVDTALLVETDGGQHVVIIESQTKPDESRRLSWPYYVAYLHNRHSCPVTLLVLTADMTTARWARQPIEVGLPEAPSQVTRPLVFGPDNVPTVAGLGQARADVMLTVLSALTHRHSDRADAILEALAAALAEVDVSTAAFLAEFTEVGLGQTPAAQIWRAIMSTMTHPYQSQLRAMWTAEAREEAREKGRKEGREEGRAEEAAIAVLRVLAARGLPVPETVARRVRECTDLTVLEDLLTRAVAVKQAEDLFATP